MEKYYSKAEAAKVLGVHERTIARYLHAGKLKGARMGKTWKISESDIKSFYEELKIETSEELRKKSKEQDLGLCPNPQTFEKV